MKRGKQQCQTLQPGQRRELQGNLGIWEPENMLLSGFSQKG